MKTPRLQTELYGPQTRPTASVVSPLDVSGTCDQRLMAQTSDKNTWSVDPDATVVRPWGSSGLSCSVSGEPVQGDNIRG